MSQGLQPIFAYLLSAFLAVCIQCIEVKLLSILSNTFLIPVDKVSITVQLHVYILAKFAANVQKKRLIQSSSAFLSSMSNLFKPAVHLLLTCTVFISHRFVG